MHLRTDNAVDSETVGGLKAAQRGLSGGAEGPVDRQVGLRRLVGDPPRDPDLDLCDIHAGQVGARRCGGRACVGRGERAESERRDSHSPQH
jgi:hypothetical protein